MANPVKAQEFRALGLESSSQAQVKESPVSAFKRSAQLGKRAQLPDCSSRPRAVQGLVEESVLVQGRRRASSLRSSFETMKHVTAEGSTKLISGFLVLEKRCSLL